MHGLPAKTTTNKMMLVKLGRYLLTNLLIVFLVQVKIFPGRKLDYEPKHCEKQKNEQGFMTAVEFSAENPYGKAVALLNLKSGFVKVQSFTLIFPT